MKNENKSNRLAEGDKIYLRLMTDEDTDRIVRWRNNPRVRNNFIYRETFTPEGHRSWTKNHVETGDVFQMIICRKEDNFPVGSVYFRDIDRGAGEAEYGIFIGEDTAIGKGYGNETAVLALRIAKERLGLKRLILRVFKDNIPAKKSYEAAGFVFDKEAPAVECSDGAVKDMVMMECCLQRMEVEDIEK